MSVVYMFTDQGDLFALSATKRVSLASKNSLTKSSVMSGQQVSDGFTQGNDVISFSGICSYSKIDELNLLPNPIQLTERFRSMRASHQRFTLFGNNLIPDLANVVILDYNVDQEKWEDGVKVSLVVEQVFISASASQTTVTAPTVDAFGDVTEEKDAGQGSKKQNEEVKSKGLLLKTFEGISG